MDEWDDRFFGLLEFLCVFFGCGASPATETPQTELQTRVEMFILHIRGCKPPLGATQSSLDTALAAIEEARLLNAAHPLLPSWLSAELDAVLAELHAQLHPLAPEPEGAPH